MNTNPVPRIESIFFQADAFNIAVSKLAQPGAPNIPLLIAQVVNASLSAELYLKCLLLIETGEIPHEHDLEKLFNLLRDEAKRAIENEWNAEKRKQSAVLDYIDRDAGEAVTARTLTDALANEGSAFVNWRYAYEPGPLCNFSLFSLPAILRSYILVVKPELEGNREGQ